MRDPKNEHLMCATRSYDRLNATQSRRCFARVMARGLVVANVPHYVFEEGLCKY